MQLAVLDARRAVISTRRFLAATLDPRDLGKAAGPEPSHAAGFDFENDSERRVLRGRRAHRQVLPALDVLVRRRVTRPAYTWLTREALSPTTIPASDCTPELSTSMRVTSP